MQVINLENPINYLELRIWNLLNKMNSNELTIPYITLNKNYFLLNNMPFWPGKYKLGYFSDNSSFTSFLKLNLFVKLK